MDMLSYLMGQNSAIKKGMHVEVVTELPTTGISNIVYLVPKQDTGTNDIFDEYLWVDDDWEHIGSTDIDLSNYYTKSEVNGITGDLDDLTTTAKSDLVSAINEVAGSSSPIVTLTSDADLRNMPTGLYYNGGTSYIRLKIALNGDTVGLSKKQYALWLNKFYNDQTTSSPGAMLYMFNESDAGIYMYYVSIATTGGQRQLYGIENRHIRQYNVVMDNTSQTISGTKTFSALPKSSVVPTNDQHLTNKKYVDDSIASAITDALGGSY